MNGADYAFYSRKFHSDAEATTFRRVLLHALVAEGVRVLFVTVSKERGVVVLRMEGDPDTVAVERTIERLRSPETGGGRL